LLYYNNNWNKIMCTHTPCWWPHCEPVHHRARRSSVVVDGMYYVVPWAFMPAVRVLVFAVSRVPVSRLLRRFICAVHVIVILHNIIILYCAFSKFENSVWLLVCDEKLTRDQSLPARLEWRAESLRWGLAERFCWPLSLRSPQRVSCIMLFETVFV